MKRLEAIVSELPEAVRVDIAEWGDHPTFRVHGKNFVFSDVSAEHLSFKLTKLEAAAVIATDSAAEPSGYGLGQHGWAPSRSSLMLTKNVGSRSLSGYAPPIRSLRQQVQEMTSRAYESDASFQVTAESSALLVIDMQDEFVRPEWTPYWVPAGSRQIPGVKQLIGTTATNQPWCA